MLGTFPYEIRKIHYMYINPFCIFPLDAKGLSFDSNSYVIHVDIYMYILSRCIDHVYGFIDNLLRLLDNYQFIWSVRHHEMKTKNTNKILFIVSFD